MPLRWASLLANSKIPYSTGTPTGHMTNNPYATLRIALYSFDSQSIAASTFNTALSVRQYLGAPQGAVYGFAPVPPRSLFRALKRTPATPVPGLYLASAYTGFGGYTGAIQSAGACADMILRER